MAPGSLNFGLADPTRLELATSAVTGQRSNQLSYESTAYIIAYFARKSKGLLRDGGGGETKAGVAEVEEGVGGHVTFRGS